MSDAIEEAPKSIFDLVPIEQGGPTARAGFLYQDHVAAAYCLDMLLIEQLSEVWCEAEDDVTLIWQNADGISVEFVQIKSNDLAHMWSSAQLVSSELLEKSLAHDRCSEPCKFRVVSKTEVNSELAFLCLERGHRLRDLSNEDVRAVHKDICGKLDVLSPNRRCASNWLSETWWEVLGSEVNIINSNLRKITKYCEKISDPLFSDQVEEFYDVLLMKIVQTSTLDSRVYPQDKKLKKREFADWVLDSITRIKGDQTTPGGVKLKRKLSDAAISSDVADGANTLRLSYRNKQLTPVYSQNDKFREAEEEVQALLHALLSKLDAGLLNDNGMEFHARCLSELEKLRDRYPTIQQAFLSGSMYSVTDRCRHRFVRFKP